MSEAKNKTSLGMEQNLEGLLCYLVWWVTGIIFYILEKDNKSVRFHAIQSMLVFFPLWLIIMVFSWVPIIRWIIPPVAALLAFILWIVLMVKAYQGEMYKLPIAGDIAERNSNPVAAPKPPETTTKPPEATAKPPEDKKP